MLKAQGRERQAQHQGTDVVQSQKVQGPVDRRDGPRQAEQGRIDELEHFAAQGRIEADDFADLGDGAGRTTGLFEDAQRERRRRRQLRIVHDPGK
jgi:hypothetical protein